MMNKLVTDVSERSKGYLTTGFPSSSIDPDQDFIILEEWRKVRMFGSAAISCICCWENVTYIETEFICGILLVYI